METWNAPYRNPPDTIAPAMIAPYMIAPDMIAPDKIAAESSHAATAMGGAYLLERFAGDQKAILTAPFHLAWSDAVWALPVAAATAALVASDAWFSRQVPGGEIARSRSLSNYGAFSLAGAAAGLYLFGKAGGDGHAAETGWQAGEAAVNAAAVDFALKNIFQRQRPYQGSGRGNFFAGGSSFPSEHAAVSWAVAGVVAHEYPGTVTRIAAYGLAAVVTVARVTGKEHFPSDAMVGGAMGYFIARQIYRRRRDPDVSTAPWGTLVETDLPAQDKVRSPRNMGSPYVPLDSWVYPALERLAALGYVQTAYLGIRPWTRMECARLLEEAGEQMRDQDEGAVAKAAAGEADALYTELSAELSDETRRRQGAANEDARLDSVYTRVTGISGAPLRDGYHFAQTIVNDYGRPYSEGFNHVTGLSGAVVAGPFSLSLRGEYQHAPAVASDAANVLQAIALEDGVSTPLPDGAAAANRVRLIEGSVGFTFRDVKLSLGRQNLWLGPGESGPLLMSDNAAPMTVFAIDSASPFQFPVLSRLLGPARMSWFLGRLSGQRWVYNPPPAEGLNSNIDPRYLVGPGFSPQPFLHGNKVSFHPTENLEFGMGVTAIFGGPGLPFTWHEYLRSYYGHNANLASNPAKRFSSFDFSYRMPGLRRWLTVYMDSAVGDEISPLGSTRPLLNPGIYLPQFPKAPKLELRLEGFKPDPRLGTMYIDRRFRSGYTNAGNVMGSWTGRQALGGEAWVKYSFTPRTTLQLGWRHQEVDRFLAGGGRLNDWSASAGHRVARSFSVSGKAQYEQWNFPALRSGMQSDFATSIEVALRPEWRWSRN